MAFTVLTSTLLWTTILTLLFSRLTSSIPTNSISLIQIPIPTPSINTNPQNTTRNAHHKHHHILPRWGDHQFCGPSTFINQISDVSPAVYDCRRLIRDFDYHDKYYDWGYTGTCAQRAISSFATCKLGININWQRLGQPCKDSDTFRFGNGDAIYVINESIIRSVDHNTGRVGTKGSMDCQTTDEWGVRKGEVVTIDWGLY